MKFIVKCKKWIKKSTSRSGHTSNSTTNASSPSSSMLKLHSTTLPSHDWRTLSPDQPPLPTFFPHADAMAVTPGAALAPMFEHRPFAFTPLTTQQNQNHHQQPQRQRPLQQNYHPLYIDYCSRPLDPILEENESSAMTSNNRTSVGDSPLDSRHYSTSSNEPSSPTKSLPSNDPSSPLTTKSMELKPLDHDLSSSSSVASPPQQDQSKLRHSHSSSSVSNHSCNLPPPTINTTWHHHQRQSFDSEGSSPIIGNELHCKRKFSKMVHATHQFQKKPNIPATMQVVFQGDNINAIRLVQNNGQESDCPFTGNPQYIPPEMFLHASCSRGLSDVWVLGISLYRMLVGNYPFKATDDRRLAKKMLHADFTIPDHLSEDVKDLLRRMLAPEQSRASLDLIMFHPWLKPYRVMAPSTASSIASPKLSKRLSNNKLRKPKWQRFLKKTCVIIFHGPYPPPSRPYRELAHLGR